MKSAILTSDFLSHTRLNSLPQPLMKLTTRKGTEYFGRLTGLGSVLLQTITPSPAGSNNQINERVPDLFHGGSPGGSPGLSHTSTTHWTQKS